MYADEPDTETESAAERRQYTILLRYEEQQILFFYTIGTMDKTPFLAYK